MPLEKANTNGSKKSIAANSGSNNHPSWPLQSPIPVMPSLDLEFDRIQNAMQSEQYTQALALSTTVVNELLDMAARFIDLRAFISKKTSRNRQELEDAILLTNIDSQSYTSFLRAAKICSIQGKLEAATEVLQKGIDVCLNNDHRKLLQQQLEMVQAQMNRRVDFVARLPYEILCNVLSHLDIATVTTCMDVCRLWCYKVLQCPTPWRIIDISDSNSSLSAITRVLPTIAPHIQELHVAFEPKFVDAWIGFFRLYNFSGLRSLRIDTEPGSNHRSLSIPLYAAVSYLANTLTDLRINLFWMTNFSLAHVLSFCRNLIVLHCSARRITESFDEKPLTFTTSLTSVYLETATDPFNVSKLVPLFEYSPCLRHISLNNTTGDILPILGTHCSGIQAIESSSLVWDEKIEESCEKIVADIISGKSVKGIQFVLVGKVRAIQPLQTQLENSQDSLKYMQLQPIDNANGASTDWEPLLSNVMYGLSYLNLDLGKESAIFRNHIPTLIRNCPNLEELILDNWCEDGRQLDVTPAPVIHRIFDVIADLNNLRRLALSLFDVRSQRFTVLLERYMTQGEHAVIRDLAVDMCPGLIASALFQIGNIVSLESLSIHFGNGIQVRQSDITEFMRLVKRLPKLLYLELGGVEFTFVDAKNLSESKTLKEIMTMEVNMPSEASDLLKRRFPEFMML